MPPRGSEDNASAPRTLVAFAAYGALLIALLFIAGTNSMDAMNPDGAAYIRLGRYWHDGQLSLATSANWGPMLSWLIALFDWRQGFSPLGARIAMGCSAAFFAMACLAWSRATMPMPAQRVMAALLVSPVAVVWSVVYITPDLLLAGWLTLGATFLARLDWLGSRRRQIGAGVCFGAAYLTKGVGLPFSILFLCAHAGVLWLGGKASLRSLVRPILVTLAAILVLAGPWIVTISLKYHRPLFSSAGSINHAIAATPDLEALHPAFSTIHAVAPGRVSAWEDPTDAPYPYWSPVDSAQQAVRQLHLIVWNIRHQLQYLISQEPIGFGFVGVALLVPLLLCSRQLEAADSAALSSVAVLCAIYAPLYASQPRFYLPAIPAGIYGAAMLAERVGATVRLSSIRRPEPFILVLIVVISWLNILPTALDTLRSGNPSDNYLSAARLVDQLKTLNAPPGGFATIGRNVEVGMYAAYLWDTTDNGAMQSLATAADLRGSGARYVLAAETNAEQVAVLRTIARPLPIQLGDLRVFEIVPP